MTPEEHARIRLQAPARAPRGDALRFLLAFLRRPRSVASVVPSSRRLTRRVARAAVQPGTRTVVELGPGTGVVTRALLAALGRDARLYALELEPDFVARLVAERDPRLYVHCADAGAVLEVLAQHRAGSVDAVVSGIPFSTLPPPAAARVVSAAWRALAPGGRFVAYQLRPHVARYANPRFGAPSVEREAWNVPPMCVYTWRKAQQP